MSNKENIFEKIGDFFEDIWDWAKGLFNAAKKAWKHLEPQIQDALLKGSSIIALINSNLDKAPDEVFALIQNKFPDLSKEKLHEALNEVDKQFGTAATIADADLLTTIQNIQKFLGSLQGNVWQAISSAMAQLLSTVFAGDQTPFAKISMLMEYVYNDFVKGGDRPPKPPKVP